MFMSQLVSKLVQFHGDVFRSLFCHRIQGQKKRKRETKKKENIPCSFFIGIEEHIKKKKHDQFFSFLRGI
jgi:hypothetical protein